MVDDAESEDPPPRDADDRPSESGATATAGDDRDGLATVAEILDDPYAREILVSTADRAMSADDLIDGSDGSRPTVYRRIRRLVDLDLLAESQELDPDGHHFKTYRARLDRVTIDLEADGFDVRIDRRTVEDDAVDRLNRLHERLTK